MQELLTELLWSFNYLLTKTCAMTINMGQLDRILRPLIAIGFIALYFTGMVTGTLGIVLLVMAGIFLVTSLVGMCPLYNLLGIRTCPVDQS